ncbi:uncharacterized protein [Miscanthus floridulus]|uniref:uncharacterized protein isoform X1 n=1 Tax=Miscanthus floridulus TaxID=154761 RepID=UPI003458DF68
MLGSFAAAVRHPSAGGPRRAAPLLRRLRRDPSPTPSHRPSAPQPSTWRPRQRLRSQRWRPSQGVEPGLRSRSQRRRPSLLPGGSRRVLPSPIVSLCLVRAGIHGSLRLVCDGPAVQETQAAAATRVAAGGLTARLCGSSRCCRGVLQPLVVLPLLMEPQRQGRWLYLKMKSRKMTMTIKSLKLIWRKNLPNPTVMLRAQTQ